MKFTRNKTGVQANAQGEAGRGQRLFEGDAATAAEERNIATFQVNSAIYQMHLLHGLDE